MCCNDLYGLSVKFIEPKGSEVPSSEVPNSSLCSNKKGIFELNLKAMCDSRYRFTFISFVLPGSTYVSTSFPLSALSKLLDKRVGCVLANFWIAAGEAYTCISRQLTPWPGKYFHTAKDIFNYWLSSAPTHI